ncbi:homoserine kinase [Acetobacteraceae bacterium]|nr:homoserine kinase [Acetobacteraceae bacterium]
MAVYTPVSWEEAQAFLAKYDLGALQDLRPIKQGTENTNFFLDTAQNGKIHHFVLTLFEKRVKEADLPWFIGFVKYLAENQFPAATPFPQKQGELIGRLNSRPALISKFLEGQNNPSPITPEICAALGKNLAKFHLIGQGWKTPRKNDLGIESWTALLKQSEADKESRFHTLHLYAEKALKRILSDWPLKNEMPQGQIHGDLFPDNVMFTGFEEKGEISLSGMIDFYFACTDFLAWDLAIILAFWCFDVNQDGEILFKLDCAQSFLKSYESVRALTKLEKQKLPLFCQGAALRFLLTRFYDWTHCPKEAFVKPKDPFDCQKRLHYFANTEEIGL